VTVRAFAEVIVQAELFFAFVIGVPAVLGAVSVDLVGAVVGAVTLPVVIGCIGKSAVKTTGERA
jgi:hypothetical protein